MNIEITDLDIILQHLDITSLEPHDDYTSEFTYKDQKILHKYIEDLCQEDKQLKEKLDCDLQWAFKYDKLVGNWNKLKEYARENLYFYSGYQGEDKYQKHFLYIANETTYVVEQLEYSDVSRYDYEFIFRPEAIIPVKIKTQVGDN